MRYHIYLSKSKAETLEMFKYYKNNFENQLSKKRKLIRSDKGKKHKV